MLCLVYNRSFEGFLTAVFEAYERKENVYIRKNGIENKGLFSEIKEVITYEAHAQRVLKKIESLVGIAGVRRLWKAFLSEDPEIEDAMLGVIVYSIKSNADIFSDFGNQHVLKIHQAAKKVEREKHRMEAFVRFKLTTDNIFYAVVEPDFNVLPLIKTHFENRYADQHWLIYDMKRNYGLYYDEQTTEIVTMEVNENTLLKNPETKILDDSEDLYQNLWKAYFKSTNIKSRKNMKLHLRHVPKRYWKYLTEKLG